MITLEDCLAFCDLTEAEVSAIAEHEHIPELAAAALAEYLLSQERGVEVIRRMIADDIRAAMDRGDVTHAQRLAMAMRHFLMTHPQGRGSGPVPTI